MIEISANGISDMFDRVYVWGHGRLKNSENGLLLFGLGKILALGVLALSSMYKSLGNVDASGGLLK